MQSAFVLEGVFASDCPRFSTVDNVRDGFHKVPSERSTLAGEISAISTEEKDDFLATSNVTAIGNALCSIYYSPCRGLLPLYCSGLVGDPNLCWIPSASCAIAAMSITDPNSMVLPAEAPWGVQFLNAVVHHTSAKGLVLITADERRFLGNAPARSVEPTRYSRTLRVLAAPNFRPTVWSGIPANSFHRTRQESQNVITDLSCNSTTSMELFDSGRFRLFWSDNPFRFHEGGALCYDFASHVEGVSRSLFRGSYAAPETTILDGVRIEVVVSPSILWSTHELDSSRNFRVWTAQKR
ncbi:hypothetical protein B0H13DRAFT_1906702 [Mycena leptocephala]|nr:hypothetical protein B0H13DRAFT_1906702 [Mycena leptocephala]